MTSNKPLINQDLLDFKATVIGSGYGSATPFKVIFGMKSATYYQIKNNPSRPLCSWYAAHLRAYKVMPYDVLAKVLKDAHGVDLKELKD